MKLSLFELPAFDPEVHVDDCTMFEQIIELAELADQIGLDSIWVAEHHLTSYGGSVPSVPVLLAAIAQRTKKLKLATGGVALPLHRPLEVAEQLSMVDNLSGGRLRIGFVRAFLAHEFEAYNVDMNESRDRFNEAVEIILGVWANDGYTYKGRFSSVENVTMTPKPIQRPRPPVTIGSIMTRESFEYAGTHGFDCMLVPYVIGNDNLKKVMQWYTDALKAAGHRREDRNVMAQYFFCCDEDEKVAYETGKKAMLKYLTYIHDAVQADRWSKDYPGYEGLAKAVKALMGDFDLLYKDRLVVGTPERCIQRLRDIHALGIDEIALMPNIPAMPRSMVKSSMELLRDRIMPALAASGLRKTA